jgi:HEPN domain-containing protein
MTKTRKFRPAYAHELLSVAAGDLDSAQLLAVGQAKRKENILFHCQQVVEKALKAVLCARGIPVPLVHDLPIILDRFVDRQVPFEEDVGDWGQFAAIRRYEEGVADLTEEEITGALKIAAAILSWAEVEVKTGVLG